MADIAGVIGMGLGGDSEPGAQERGAGLGDFLGAIAVVAEAGAKLARAAGLRCRPVPLMPISA